MLQYSYILGKTSSPFVNMLHSIVILFHNEADLYRPIIMINVLSYVMSFVHY